MYPRSAHRFAMLIQKLHCASDDKSWHPAVDFVRQTDKPGLESVDLRLPFKVKRIDRDAVPTKAGAGIEWHKSEGLRRCTPDHFPHIDVHMRAHQCDFIYQSDIDA